MNNAKIMRNLATVAVSLLFCALLPVGALFHAVDSTLLDVDFVRNEIQHVDVPVMAREVFKEQIAAEEPPARLAMEIMIRAWDADAQAQLVKVAEGLHDYMTGRSAEVDVPLNFVGYKIRLLKIAKEEIPALLPPEVAREMAALTPTERQEAMSRLEQQAIGELSEGVQLPTRLTLEKLPNDMRQPLESAREAIAAMQPVRIGVFVGLLALAALIVWLGSWRWLGGACLMGAAMVGLVEWSLHKGLAEALTMAEAQSLPTSVQSWVADLFGQAIAAMQAGVYVLVAVGVGLLLVTVLLMRRTSPAA